MRYSSFEPRGKGSPNGSDAFQADRGGYVSAEPDESSPLTGVDDQPLTAEDCAIGEVVAGKYLIEGVIGRGSMGVVVRATHLGFDELVALKFIRPEMRTVDGIVSRFAREAKASVRIRNEHAVNVLDVGVADPIGPFFVMEYLEGINLEELVDSQGAFDPQTAVRYVLEACEALAAAHAQGIIHRDIKPQNIFLAWQGRLELIKLLDFGISKAALRGQMFGDDLSINEKDWVMGTPLYMSPEQLRHAPDVDERTDIWSLGAVMYELLCGQPLFSGNTQTEVCRQVFSAGARPLRVAVPGVPEELWDIIERCLSQDKEQRFSSVAELSEALLPFAPAGACLHVERVRALLGLKPIDFLGFDDAIEDIDVEPIEELEAEALPLTVPAARRRRRPPYWVELALPVLACAVVWIGYRQWQLAQAGAEHDDDAIQTVALALSQRPECPAPAAPQAVAPPPASAPPGARAPDDAAATPGTSGPAASSSSDADRPVSAKDGAAPGATPQRAAVDESSPARRAAGSAKASDPSSAARGPARPESAAASPAVEAATEPGGDSASELRSAGARRAQKPKAKVEPKLEFRLIDEQPPSDFYLVPDGNALPATRPVPSR
jgi:serine/threonine protein kinase